MKQGNAKPGPRSLIQGVVKARKCRYCGDREMGIVTGSEKYIVSKPGMKITVSRATETKA